MSDRYQLKSRTEIAANTIEIILTPLDEPPFTFAAGQYANVEIPDLRYRDDFGNNRDFSIAAAPGESALRFAYRDSSSAFKRGLAKLPLGSPLIVRGPYGAMILPDDPGVRVALVAGGIGITPFHSMLKWLAGGGQKRPVTLLYANREPAAAAFLAEIRGWARDGICQLIEHYGLIDQDLLKQLVDKSAAELYYLAGPVTMTNLGMEHLTELGVPRQAILLEQFIGYE